MKIIKPLIILACIVFHSCAAQSRKINGLSFVASRDAISEKHVTPVVSVNANYVALMPFGFIKNLNHPKVSYNSNKQWFGETVLGTKQYIKTLRTKEIKIMLKPQIWVWQGEFTGFIEMKNETDWKTLEHSYSQFILEYAKLAQAMQIEIFCIGTELEKFIVNRASYWTFLISEIKKIYKGKLTYAANWDEFKRTPFWNQLDYIGIDAYFPVSSSKTPTLTECIEGWDKHKTHIEKISKKEGKPILFTEFGYRSVNYTGKTPWLVDKSINDVNLAAQYNATQSLFKTFWNKDWFAGGFVWKWFHNHQHAGGEQDNRFTPQNKPVEKLIRENYAFYK